MNQPVVILGDEPTGNLDSGSSADVIAMMREINRTTGTTFVLVTHDPDVAAACDRIILMRDGRGGRRGGPGVAVAQQDSRGREAAHARGVGTIPAVVPA